MNHIKSFEDTQYLDYKTLIHTTSVDIAYLIKMNGFNPKQLFEYKYYSTFGKEGIYFYDNLRWVQQYAYYLKNKLKTDNKVALIYVKIPIDIICNNDKMEDGFFIKNENLNKLEILKIEYKSPGDIFWKKTTKSLVWWMNFNFRLLIFNIYLILKVLWNDIWFCRKNFLQVKS